MKKLVRFAGGVALNLILGAAAFAQHYTQTNLVSNMSGVAPVTDPQLINAWAYREARDLHGGSRTRLQALVPYTTVQARSSL